MTDEITNGLRGHNAPCEVCGEPCCALAGDPGRWPTPTNHKTYSHLRCVSKAIHQYKEKTGQQLSAEHIVRTIAIDGYELSLEKIKGQRDDFVKWCRKWCEDNADIGPEPTGERTKNDNF